MDEYESLSHSKWECKYHVVFIPKCRRKTLYGELRRHLGDVFRKLAQQKESRIEEYVLTVSEKDSKAFVATLAVKGSKFTVSEKEVSDAGNLTEPPREP